MNSVRHTIICCVAQVAAIVTGVLVTAKVHKLMRDIYGQSGWYPDHTHYSQWFRDYGAWLLALPLVWLLVAIAASDEFKAQCRTTKIESAGTFLTVLIGLAAVSGVISCFRTPMLYFIQK